MQDYYQNTAQVAIMNAFQTAQIPLTLGLISFYFGSDSTVVAPVQTALASPCTWKVEVANNGWKGEAFSALTLSAQENLLAQCVNKTKYLLGVTPTTFIPPQLSFNANTLTALSASGFKNMASHTGKYITNCHSRVNTS